MGIMTPFFKIAKESGAAEYGRARAEAYGRRAKAAVVLGWLVALALVAGTVYVAGAPWG